MRVFFTVCIVKLHLIILLYAVLYGELQNWPGLADLMASTIVKQNYSGNVLPSGALKKAIFTL